MKAVGYDSSTIVERPCYKFKFSTWESFRNPYLNKNSLLSQILKQNVGTNIPCENLNFDILQKILVQLKNKLAKRNWPTMVKEHCLKSKNFRASHNKVSFTKKYLIFSPHFTRWLQYLIDFLLVGGAFTSSEKWWKGHLPPPPPSQRKWTHLRECRKEYLEK